MNYTVHYFTLDTEKADAQAFLSVRQGETNRRLGIKLVTDGKPYEYSDDVFATIAGVYPDGTRFMNPAAISNGTVIYALTANNTANIGQIPCELRLYGRDDALLVSASFNINVYSNTGITEDDFEEDDVDALTQLISDAIAAINFATENVPTASVSKEGSISTLTVESLGGTTQVEIYDGETGPQGDTGAQGPAGDDGVSPTIEIENIMGGHSVTIYDAEHPDGQTFEVMDGEDGASDAGEVTYDPDETYSAGTVGAALNHHGSEIAGKVDKSAQAEKTDAMTQPVGIDNDGKLWALPGGSSGDGDMSKATYDPDETVADAGGIAAYVEAHGGGAVNSVNEILPDGNGNVQLDAGNIEYVDNAAYPAGSVGSKILDLEEEIHDGDVILETDDKPAYIKPIKSGVIPGENIATLNSIGGHSEIVDGKIISADTHSVVSGERNTFNPNSDVFSAYFRNNANDFVYGGGSYSYFMPCKPNAKYFCKYYGSISGSFLRAAYTNISKETFDALPRTGGSGFTPCDTFGFVTIADPTDGVVITTGADATYIIVQIPAAIATDDLDNIRIVPGKEEFIDTLIIPQALRTAYPLHSDGTNVDEYLLTTMKAVIRCGFIDLGSITYEYNGTNFKFTLDDRKLGRVIGILCEKYEYGGYVAARADANADGKIYHFNNSNTPTNTSIYICDHDYTDAAALKSALSGVKLIYELNTPLEVDISSYLPSGFTPELEVKSGGIVTFEQTDSAFVIPNSISYTIERNTTIENVVISLADFAKGDGTTDDTDAINQALEQAENGTLIVPAGTFLFSGTLKVKSGTHIIGGPNAIFQLADSFSLSGYSWRPALGSSYAYRYPMIQTEQDSVGCVIEGIKLIGQTESFKDENEDGFCLMGSNHILRNVIATDINYFPASFSGRSCITPGYGIAVIDADTIIVENCSVERCGYEGIGTERAENITVTNCKCGVCNQTCLQVHASSKSVRFNNCDVTVSDKPSITFDADPETPMEDIVISGCTCGKGIAFVAGGENDITIVNNRIKSGGIVCNNHEYRERIKILGNTVSGRIDVYADDSIYSNNIVDVSTGSYCIIARGNGCIVENTVGIGSVKDTTIVTHEDEA